MSSFQQQSPKSMDTRTRDPITNPPTKTTLSSFLSIENSSPKTTIKVHRILSETIQRGNSKNLENTENSRNKNHDNNKKRRCSRPRMSSPKRSGFKAFFRNKKKESPFTETKEVSGNLEGKGKQPMGSGNDEKILKQSKNNYKKPIKVPAFLADIFDRKCSFNSTEALRSKLCYSSSITCKIPRFSFTSREVEKNKDMKNEAIEGRVEREEISGEGELCKKRILMGEKCKPLNSSGVLHYDENGVFLTEY